MLKEQQVLTTQEFVDIDQLCLALGISRSTVRRDLMEMEKRGVLRRVHGGAISLKARDEALDFRTLSTSCHEEKGRIGKAAAGMITDGQTVIIGGGSTAVEVARNLVDRPIQVITNSIPVAEIFWDCRQVEVTLTGGYLYPRLGIQLGPICERMLSNVAADLFICGVRGITSAGLSDTNTLIVGSVRKMIEVSQKVIVVADHTKFGRDGMIHLAELDTLDAAVSDSSLGIEHQELLNAHNVQCVLA